MRKLIEWSIFAVVAIGAVLFVRRLVPWAAFQYRRATAEPASPRVDPALRSYLREAERKLDSEDRAAVPDRPGTAPCLVIATPAGVGPRASKRSKIPVRDCLELAPGGPPVNAFELDLRTDTPIFVQTDMSLPGDPPIAFTRVVEPLIEWNQRFQIFLQNEYEIFPFGDRFPFTYQKLQLADRREILFQRISHGTSYADAVYEHSARSPLFDHALEGWNGDGWDVDLPGGKTLVFPSSYYARRPPQSALVGVLTPSGGRLTLRRDQNGNLQSVQSSDGRWMKLGYQGALVVSLEDSAGEKASYLYDSTQLLASSTNAEGETLTYSYDQKDELTSVWDGKTNKDVLEVHYGALGAVTGLRVGSGPRFRFSYGVDPTGSYAEVGVEERGVGHWTVLLGPCTENSCTYRVRGR